MIEATFDIKQQIADVEIEGSEIEVFKEIVALITALTDRASKFTEMDFEDTAEALYGLTLKLYKQAAWSVSAYQEP